MKRVLFTFLFVSLFALGNIHAQSLEVSDIQFGTDVENREIVGTDSTFTSDVGTVFCYTHVTGAQDTTEIAHVWYYQDQEKARVPLEVRSSDWRTWSSKQILSTWVGEWSVQVEDEQGNVLATSSFIINE